MPWGHRSIARAIYGFLKSKEKEGEIVTEYAEVKAETGVGPAIASGSQTASGICADLPVQPKNISNVIAVIVPLPKYFIVSALSHIGIFH